MRTSLFAPALLLMLFITLDLHAQGIGTLSFTSVGAPLEKRIWINNTCVPGDGVLAGGGTAGYSVALYWGLAGTTDDRNMVQLGASTSLLGTTGGAATSPAGTYFGGGRTVTGQAVNGPVLAFQVRGWSTSAGSTYEAAVASGASRIGKGPIFTLKTKNPSDATELNPNLYQAPGYTGFALALVGDGGCYVPEPSSIMLTLLGTAALLLFRRKRS